MPGLWSSLNSELFKQKGSSHRKDAKYAEEEQCTQMWEVRANDNIPRHIFHSQAQGIIRYLPQFFLCALCGESRSRLLSICERKVDPDFNTGPVVEIARGSAGAMAFCDQSNDVQAQPQVRFGL